MRRGDFLFPLLLVLLWVVMIIIVNPIGNFPLNDDWQYARPVWYLINKGYYFAPGEFSPIITAQVLWGALFCLPCGFSFTALRISVLVLGLIGVLVFYFLVLHLSKNKKVSFLCALLLLANPFYFSLSNTFMSDVPFLVFALIAIYLFLKALENSGTIYIVFAVMFSIIATLVRQIGVLIPVAYAIAAILKTKPNLKQWIAYVIPALIVFGAFELMLIWLKHIGSELRPYEGKSTGEFLSKPWDKIQFVFNRTSFLLLYSGIFLLPLTLFSKNILIQKISLKAKIGVMIFVVMFIPVLLHEWKSLPIGNVIGAGTIGPKTFHFENFWSNNVGSNLPHFSTLFSLLSLVGGILLLFKIGTSIFNSDNKATPYQENIISKQQVFIAICILGFAVLLFIPGFFYDRYLLTFIPLLLLLFCRTNFATGLIRIPVFIISFLLIFLMAAFSAMATHDYLDWNRSRWDAWNYATTNLKIPPANINGGIECNGWIEGHVYNPAGNNHASDEYLLSFGPHEGYATLKEFPFQNYLPYEKKNILIIHRK